MHSRNLIAPRLLLIVSFIALSSLSPAQQPSNPSLDDILLHLRDDFVQYHATIPSFFCDEHVVSAVHQRGTSIPPTIADSTFRLRRNTDNGNTALYESRDIKTINNQPASPGSIITGAAIFTGGFSDALALVNSGSKACFNYRLSHHGHNLVIEYSPKQAPEHPETCLSESNSGRAFIDPETLHIVRIEDKTLDHPMPGGGGLWTWTIDFHPVDLSGQTFWLPGAITSKAASNNLPIAWTFTAHYSNCHKLTVTSHIVPDGDN